MKISTTALALLISGTALAHEPGDDLVRLTDFEEGAVISGAGMAYDLALLTLPDAGLEPYICSPFPVEWDEFYAGAEANVRHQLSHMTRKERQNLGVNIRFRVRQAVFEEYGCY